MHRQFDRKRDWLSLAAGLTILPLVLWAAADRPPAVAGSFYPGDSIRLSREVDQLLKTAAPAGQPGELVAILAPHAGYEFSAPIAAQAFSRLKGDYDTVVILGTGHYTAVRGAALYAHGAYRTPLGPVPIDESLAEELLRDSPRFEDNPKAHEQEHSIEVQLPFLQRALRSFKILPIVMNSDDPEAAADIGRRLAAHLKKRRALLVLSSDLSHYPAESLAKAVDSTTLYSLQQMDPARFWKTNELTMARHEPGLECTYCGQAAVMTGLVAAEVLGADRAVLLKYMNSAEVPKLGDPGRTVGYAAVAFYHTGKKGPIEEPLSEGLQNELLAQAREALTEASAGLASRPAPLSKLPPLNQPSAVFVTLLKNGQLRGCIGALAPETTLLEAVRKFARAAALDDPRFEPVKTAELPELRIEISVLSAPTPVTSAKEIRPGRGVFVRKDRDVGVFLPDVWKELPSKAQFLTELCRQKAHLPPDCDRDPAAQFSTFTTQTIAE